MQDTLPTTVVKNTFSVSDLHRRADILQRFLEYYFFEPGTKNGKRTELIVAYYHDADAETIAHAEAVAAWGDDVLDAYTADNLYERILAFKQSIKSLPKITLYVPVRFTAIQIERIGMWCRKEVQEGIMLDLKIEPGAVGGCAFAYNNTFHDVSFAYFLNKERAKVIDLVRTYGK